MHEILRHLPENARVLDLGCRTGSFDASIYPLRTIRSDIEAQQSTKENFVQADASRLPFATGSFDAVVANHSLEHFDSLDRALEEIARVVKRRGSIYIAVPDSSTFCDRIYRWLGKGGGHVNAFRSRKELTKLIEHRTGIILAASRPLMTSFSFLNRKNRSTAAPRKLLLVGGGRESTLILFSGLTRAIDRWFHARMSMYGWALYFGALEEGVERRPWSNVCVRCGSGYSSSWLHANGRVQRRWGLLPGFDCPQCRAWNCFTRDDDYAHLE